MNILDELSLCKLDKAAWTYDTECKTMHWILHITHHQVDNFLLISIAKADESQDKKWTIILKKELEQVSKESTSSWSSNHLLYEVPWPFFCSHKQAHLYNKNIYLDPISKMHTKLITIESEDVCLWNLSNVRF